MKDTKCSEKKRSMAKKMKGLPPVSSNKKNADKMSDGTPRTKPVAE